MVYLNGKEGKPGAQCRFIFQWKITGLQFVAYLNGRLYLREAGGAKLNGKGGITMDLFQQEIPCFEYWAYLNRGLNLRMLDSMGNGQPGPISTGNFMSTIFGLSQQEKFKVSWIQQEKKGNQDSFQWKISVGSQIYISMGNHRFTIYGSSQ